MIAHLLGGAGGPRLHADDAAWQRAPLVCAQALLARLQRPLQRVRDARQQLVEAHCRMVRQPADCRLQRLWQLRA